MEALDLTSLLFEFSERTVNDVGVGVALHSYVPLLFGTNFLHASASI